MRTDAAVPADTKGTVTALYRTRASSVVISKLSLFLGVNAWRTERAVYNINVARPTIQFMWRLSDLLAQHPLTIHLKNLSATQSR